MRYLSLFVLVLASCAVDPSDGDPEAIVAQVASNQCISIGNNPIGPDTLCGGFANRWLAASSPLASYGWPLAGPGDWNAGLGFDLGIPTSNDVMVFERGAMNSGFVPGADCQTRACNSLLGRWYVKRTFTTPLVEGGPIPAGSPDCARDDIFMARDLGCVGGVGAGDFTTTYGLTGGLERNGFPLSSVKLFGSNNNRPFVVTERNVYDYFPENPQPFTWQGRLIGVDYLESKGFFPARSKPRSGKCACSGGPGCGQVFVEPVLDGDPGNDHDRCTAAVNRACAKCPAGCKQEGKGCKYK
jgi:hypothetical protein